MNDPASIPGVSYVASTVIPANSKYLAKRVDHNATDKDNAIDRRAPVKIVNRDNSAPEGLISPDWSGGTSLAAPSPLDVAMGAAPAPAPAAAPEPVPAAAVLQAQTLQGVKPKKAKIVITSPGGKMTLFLAAVGVSDTAVMLVYNQDDETAIVEPPVYGITDDFSVTYNGVTYPCISGGWSCEVGDRLFVTLPRVSLEERRAAQALKA